MAETGDELVKKVAKRHKPAIPACPESYLCKTLCGNMIPNKPDDGFLRVTISN
jgi:hypothetical protein